jgi:hypothetical protein
MGKETIYFFVLLRNHNSPVFLSICSCGIDFVFTQWFDPSRK